MNVLQQKAPISILLADDDSDDRQFFDKALEKLTISRTLTIVNDGEELMKYLSEHSEHLPDVLFLDLNMPRKNGFECLSEIKENEKLKNLYVIMFSTSFPQDKNYEREMIANLFKIGANDYIHKSSDLAQLQQAIGQALTKVVEKIRLINIHP